MNTNTKVSGHNKFIDIVLNSILMHARSAVHNQNDMVERTKY